ncbi:MAG: membrane protein insertase YidC [Sphingomicrobium sp.]
MNDNRNLMMAIVLSALVLFGWSFLSDRFMPAAPHPAQVTASQKAAPLPQAGPAMPARPTIRSRTAVLGESPRVTIATPSLQGSINLKGARFDDLMLVRQREALAPTSPPVRLLSPAGAQNAYFAGFGWTGDGVATPDANTVWTASAPTLTPKTPVTLSWSNPTGQKFELIVAVDEGYLFTIRQRVTNLAPAAVAVRPYGLVSRATKSADPSTWTNHVGPIAFLAGKADYGTDWKTLDEDKAGVTRDSRGGWLGFTDKYWLTALVPAADSQVAASFRKGDSGAYQADYAAAPIIVAPGRAISGDTRFFAGAKEKPWLDTYESAGITKLSKSIDWGWFEWFMRPIFSLLTWLFHATGNFGVAIIILTFIVRALMFPIADKQFRSMAGMRRVQPKMKAIQERHKEDKPRLQQEMLKLYQEEKINPAAGCAPILLQVPVFYALYKTLMVSVEMRHQPFVAWIRDLSAPDPAHILNLFGLLHFTPPSFLAIGPLAILLGLTMWLQFKLNPAQMDPVQQQIFGFMPWVMMFVMAPFAAGLLLYWVTSNILTIAQQKWLYKRYDMQAGTVILEATPIKK